MKWYIKSSSDQSFEYSLLARLRSDCEYVLNTYYRPEVPGDTSREERQLAQKYLWANNAKDQIAKMKELYKNLKVKPEWITLEDIANYEKQFKDILGEDYRGEPEYVGASVFGKDYDVFMLMEYIPDDGETGPSGDRFYCIGKFFASSLSAAKKELEIEKSKYSDINLGSLYVSEYNSNFDDNETNSYGMPVVFSNLVTLFEKRINTSGDYEGSEELPFEI